MPRIDTYTAETKPTVPDQPNRLYTSDQPASAGVTEAAGKFGLQISNVAANAEEQAAGLEFLDVKNKRDTGKAGIILDLQTDPEVRDNPLLFQERYKERMGALDKNLATTIKHKEAAGHFNFYRETKSREDDVEVRAAGVKMQIDKNSADYVVQKNILSMQAASARTDDDFNTALAIHHALVVQSVRNNSMTREEGEKELVEFRKMTALNNMRVEGARNATNFRKLLNEGRWSADLVSETDKIQVAEHVNAQERIAENNQQEQTAKVQQFYEWGKYRLAAAGVLPDTDLKAGEAGLDPMMPSPTKWANLRRINEKAANGGSSGVAGIQALRLAYGSIENPKKADYYQAIKAINLFMEDSNPDAKTVTAARQAVEYYANKIESLDAEARAVASAARGERGEQRAIEREIKTDARIQQHERERMIERKIRSAEALYTQRNNRVIVGTGIPRQIQENRLKKEKDMLRTITEGRPELDPEAIVDLVLGKNVGTVKPGPDPDEDSIDFLTSKPGQQ